MLSHKVRDIMHQGPLLAVPPQATVASASRSMADADVGAVLVVDGERLLGIFTEHDAVCRVLAAGVDAGSASVTEVMTARPVTVGPDSSYGHALQLMQAQHTRHLPVIECGRVIGLVSARNALDPELEEFVSEAQRREAYAREASSRD